MPHTIDGEWVKFGFEDLEGIEPRYTFPDSMKEVITSLIKRVESIENTLAFDPELAQSNPTLQHDLNVSRTFNRLQQ